MNRLIVILILLLVFDCVCGQTLPAPTTTGIIDGDYGPRWILPSQGKSFHYGIDFQCPLGIEGKAIETGIIKEFGEWTNENAFIKINSNGREWRYLHVESFCYENINGDKLWEYVPNFFAESADNDDVIFLRHINAGNNLETERVLVTSAFNGSQSTIVDPETGNIVPLSNTVTQGNWMYFPRPYNGHPHLHIDLGNVSYTNPLRFISHNDLGSPSLSDCNFKRILNNKAVPFTDAPVTITPVYGTTILFEGRVITTTEKDMEKFSIWCENGIGTLVYSKNWNYTDYQDKHNTSLTDVIKAPKANEMSFIYESISEGVYPYGTSQNQGDVGREYFKLKWPSKESKITGQTEAKLNQSARYPDGEYSVIFQATDITDNASPETKKDIILDNHQPYVQEVSIESGKKIYGAIVSYNSNDKLTLNIDQQTISGCADYENDLIFYVTASESMKNVSIKINGLEGTEQDLILTNVDEELYKWKGTINKSDLDELFSIDGIYQITISGKDKADNNIVNLNLSENGSEMLVSWLPSRNNEGIWIDNLPDGETGHKIPFCTGSLLKAVFNLFLNEKEPLEDAEMAYGYSPLSVNFVDASTGGPLTWSWDFGDNSLPIAEQNPQHTFVNEGDEPIQFNVCLKVCNEDGCDITLKNKLITVYPDDFNLAIPIADFNFRQESYKETFEIQFYNYSVGEINTIKWDFGDDSPTSSENEPIHSYQMAGKYTVTLSLNEGAGPLEEIYRDEIEVFESTDNLIPIDFNWTCISNEDNMYNAEGLNGEIIDFEIADHIYGGFYNWDMGDGTIYDLSSPHHAYLNTGEYSVALNVKDFNGKLLGTITKIVTIVPGRQIITPDENEILLHDNLKVCDLELQGDELFVTLRGNPNLFIYKFDYNTESWVLAQDPLYIGHDDNTSYHNIEVAGDLLIVAWTGYSNEVGRGYFFKKINDLWVKQTQQLTDPENNFMNFGFSMSMSDGWAMFESHYNSNYKLSFWKYNENTNEWTTNSQNNYYTQSLLPGSTDLKASTASWRGKVFKLAEDESWFQIYNGLYYNDDHYPSKSSIIDNDYYHTGNIENTLRTYVFNGESYDLIQPVLKIQNGGCYNFSESISERNNYLLTGNDGWVDVDGYCSAGSSILFRRNKDDENYKFTMYRTFYPINSFIGDSYGIGVRMNHKHIVVVSNGIDNNQVYKAPSIYAYKDYAYFGDYDLTIESLQNYRKKNNDPMRFEARNIEIGGDKSSSVNNYDNLNLIGQKIVLKPGFSATNGGVFKGTATICTDCANNLKSKASLFSNVAGIGNETGLYSKIINPVELNGNLFKILPNPFKDNIIIEATDGSTIIEKVEIFNLNGSNIFSKTIDNELSAILLNVLFLEKGVYVVAIYSGDFIINKKLVKL